MPQERTALGITSIAAHNMIEAIGLLSKGLTVRGLTSSQYRGSVEQSPWQQRWRIADLGDQTSTMSVTSDGIQTSSMFALSAGLTGFRMGITGIHGGVSYTTSQVLAIIDNVYSLDSYGNPISDPPQVLHVSCGIYDCIELAAGSATYTIDDTLDNLTAIKDWCIERNIISIFSSLSHESPGLKRTYMDQVNSHLFSMASQNQPFVKYANYASVIDDTGTPDDAAITGTMLAQNYTSDYGVLLASDILVDVLHEIIGNNIGRSAYIGNRESIAAGYNYVGTITTGTGSTAIGPVEWDAEVGSFWQYGSVGTCSVTFSKEQEAGEYHDWQVVDVSAVTSDSVIALTKPISILPARTVHDVEVYISDTSEIGFPGLGSPGVYVGVAFFNNLGEIIGWDNGYLVRSGGAYSRPLNIRVVTNPISTPVGATSAALSIMWVNAAGTAVTLKARNSGGKDVG